MTPIMPPRLLALLLAAGIAAQASAAAPGAAAKAWKLQPNGCEWLITGEDGRSHVASISRGDELMLSLTDAAFLGWSESERPRVELVFDGDPERRVFAEGWATHAGEGSTSSSFGLYLDAQARRALGGATRMELRRDGKPVFDLPLAATPGQAELDACVPPPDDGHSDEE